MLGNLPMARLLFVGYAHRKIVLILLGVTIALNYLSNIVYIIVFLKYIKPLIEKPRQIDVIANVAVMVAGTLTNYRLGLIAFSKMFPKPYIYVSQPSKLTPIHYLCIASIIMDILAVAGCGLLLYN